MATRLDAEMVEAIIIGYVQADLAAKAVEINAQKNDGVTINNIQNYFTTLTEETNNINEFILYGMDNIDAEGIGPATVSTFTMVVFTFDVQKLNTLGEEWRKKAFRYTRAMQEIIQSHYKDDGRISEIEITGLLPQTFQDNENSPLYKIGGVLIEGKFG